MTPVAEALIADVFRQAMREVLYEDELETRARQQRALCMRRTVEEIEKQRLQYEDERLNKIIVSMITCTNNSLYLKWLQYVLKSKSIVLEYIDNILTLNS